jgi:hypothetical protein
MRVAKSSAVLLLALLAGCPDDSSGDTTPGETMTGSSTSTGSTSSGSTSTGSNTTSDSGSETSSGGSTSGPSIGCTPGDPCCNDAGEFEECWIDSQTDLVWELVPAGGNPNVADAGTYCGQLTLAGASGWRVPTLDELRTLVRGCADTQTGGACELTDDCATTDCRNDACDGCIDAANQGPAMFGCYWEANLQGECGRYWSSTGPGGGLGWIVDFDDATVRQADAALPAGLVRCVASLG